MTNITEADHDVVDWLYEMGVIAPHHLRLVNEAFAQHREQTERQAADQIEADGQRIAELEAALRGVIDACDQGRMVARGAGGMTIEAQYRNSVINGVPAWPIETARAALGDKI